MKILKAIVAVDKNWGIGLQGQLLERIPEDQDFFKQTTINKVVVMGRKTFESLPGKEPLTDRVNIVLSSKINIDGSKVIIYRSINQLLEMVKQYPSDDVFVIGGELVYNQLLPYCDEVYVTKFDNTHQADKYFNNLDNDKTWEKVSQSEPKKYNNIQFTFEKYKNKYVKKI